MVVGGAIYANNAEPSSSLCEGTTIGGSRVRELAQTTLGMEDGSMMEEAKRARCQRRRHVPTCSFPEASLVKRELQSQGLEGRPLALLTQDV